MRLTMPVTTPQSPAITQQDFLALLAMQRGDYERSLAGRVADIASLWAAICAGRASQGSRERLIRMAHSLAGSAGVFGLDDIGAAAREVELALDSATRSGAPIGRCLAELESLTARRARS